ncbi:unnamed protein product [Ascophyllum nodosum]
MMWSKLRSHGALAFAACLICPMISAQYIYVRHEECNTSAQTGYDFQVEPATGLFLHWSLSPELGVVSFYGTIAVEVPGWFAFGFSSDGHMIGSDAIVGFPTPGTVVEYDLDTKVSALIQPSPVQEITEAAIEKADGITSLAFTRPVTPVGEGKLPLQTGVNVSITMIWALGPEETFGYHFERSRGAFSVDLLCSDVASNPPAGLPVSMAPTLAPEVEHFISSPTATYPNSDVSSNPPAGVPVTMPSVLASEVGLLTAGPTATYPNVQDKELTSDASRSVTLQLFSTVGFERLPAEGFVGAVLVGTATIALTAVGMT